MNNITAQQRLDSRGNPTTQGLVHTDHGTFHSLVLSGASTGVHEAVELRDGDKSVYGGKGVLKTVHNVTHVIAPGLLAKKVDPATDLKGIDQFMRDLDGTHNNSKLDANAILGINQIGTITEAIAAATSLFHRDGAYLCHTGLARPLDDFIADLTVAINADHLKSGAPARSERVAKYNRLMDIEAELKVNGKTVGYTGESFTTH